VRKRIDEVNPVLDTVEVLMRKEIFDILTQEKTVESKNN